jgi:hypothetical protein
MNPSDIKKPITRGRLSAMNNLLDSGAVGKYLGICEENKMVALYIMTNKKVKPADYLFWAVKQEIDNPIRKLLLIVLANRADKKGQSYASHTVLAADCGCSRRSVIYAQKELEDAGFIEVEKRFNGGIKTSSLYTVNLVPTDVNVVPIDVQQLHNGSAGDAQGVVQQLHIKHPVVNTHLNTQVKGWDEWVSYRTEIKKQMTPATVKKQIKFLERFSPDQQQIIIDQSIQNGWAGLFEPKGQQHGQQHKSAIETVKYSDLYPSDDIVG